MEVIKEDVRELVMYVTASTATAGKTLEAPPGTSCLCLGASLVAVGE